MARSSNDEDSDYQDNFRNGKWKSTKTRSFSADYSPNLTQDKIKEILGIQNDNQKKQQQQISDPSPSDKNVQIQGDPKNLTEAGKSNEIFTPKRNLQRTPPVIGKNEDTEEKANKRCRSQLSPDQEDHAKRPCDNKNQHFSLIQPTFNLVNTLPSDSNDTKIDSNVKMLTMDPEQIMLDTFQAFDQIEALTKENGSEVRPAITLLYKCLSALMYKVGALQGQRAALEQKLFYYSRESHIRATKKTGRSS